VRDAAQVLGLARHLAELQATGSLCGWFAVPADERQVAERDEAWILGGLVDERPFHRESRRAAR
jgi:hypothetical protein